jgi:hypothetical protein
MIEATTCNMEDRMKAHIFLVKKNVLTRFHHPYNQTTQRYKIMSTMMRFSFFFTHCFAMIDGVIE